MIVLCNEANDNFLLGGKSLTMLLNCINSSLKYIFLNLNYINQ